MNKMIVLSIMILALPLQGFPADKNVHLATLNWEPYIGENLEDLGFGAEILRVAFQRAGYKVNFSFMPWVRALKDVEIGDYDAVCFAYYSEKRSKKYLFSYAYANSILGFCKLRKSKITFQSMNDLTRYRIGVVRGFVNTPEFDSLKTLKKEEVKNELMNLMKLLDERVDLIVIDKFIMQHLMKKHFPDRENEIEFLDPPLTVHPLYLMFSKQLKSSEEKVGDFNKALEMMKKDGTIQAIMKRFGYAHQN